MKSIFSTEVKESGMELLNGNLKVKQTRPLTWLRWIKNQPLSDLQFEPGANLNIDGTEHSDPLSVFRQLFGTPQQLVSNLSLLTAVDSGPGNPAKPGSTLPY